MTTLLLAALLPSFTIAPPTPPTTEKHPVSDTIQGQTIADPYRWLEDWSDPKVKAWSESQNTYARSVLDALPHTADIRARLTELENAASVTYGSLQSHGGKLFAMKNQPPKQQPFLVVLDGPNATASERVIVDPNTLDAKGLTAIDIYSASLDGKYVAVSLSRGGSESGDVHVYEVATGREIDTVIPRVNGGTAGGSVSWAGDGQGFFYTRYPRGTERPPEDMDFYQQVYFHKLGEPTEKDKYEIGKDFPRIAEVALDTSDDGHWTLATVANGDGGEFAHYLRGQDGKWVQVTRFEDRVLHAALGYADDLFLVSRKNAPRGRVLHLNAGDPLIGAREVVPASDAVIETITTTPHLLYVTDQIGGPSQLRVFNNDGKDTRSVPLAPISSVEQVVHIWTGDDVLFATQTFTSPAAWIHYDASTGATAPTALSTTSSIDYSDTDVVREMATSKDGTKVPLSIITKKGTKLDGSSPTILWGYGGYSVSESPGFSARRRVWIEQGGIYVIANIRGGGEFGEEWHSAGNLTKKQNVFDDFTAAAEHLVKRGYTTKDKLALMGGSNGGLLMGAALTQHPGQAKAVVSSVGIYDMLRVELSPNGAFNVTEFGTVKNPEQFKAMFAYSPYHHVKDAQRYPDVLFTTGANDPRVDPAQSRKMTAELQAAQSSLKDPGLVLLRTSANAGHGIGSSLHERVELNVDIYAFLFHELGVNYTPVPSKSKGKA
jgi:prolyl oligopeptidase